MSKLLALIRSDQFIELVKYGIVGVLTTVVNLVVKYLFLLPFGDTDSNFLLTAAIVVGWIASVAFAYVANKIYVCKTRGTSPQETLREAGSFVTARLLSLGIDWVFVLATVNLLGMDKWISMILSNIVVIILNYFASKLWIFKKAK